jgi:hypothetical protein
MPPDGFHHFIEWQLTKVVFASTGFHSREARRTVILQNIENQCGHCDYWLHWSKGLRLFMEIAQDATWWFSPLHRMSPNKCVFYCSVCQHWISLMGGKKDLVSIKYWKSMLSLWLLISLMDRSCIITDENENYEVHLLVFFFYCEIEKEFRSGEKNFLWELNFPCCLPINGRNSMPPVCQPTWYASFCLFKGYWLKLILLLIWRRESLMDRMKTLRITFCKAGYIVMIILQWHCYLFG